MNKFYMICIASFALMMSGCATMDIANDYDTGYNFHQIKTYAWVQGIKIDSGDGRIDDKAIEMRMRKAIENELRLKGLTKVESGSPDILVGFNAAINEPLYRNTFYESGMTTFGSVDVYYAERTAYRHPEYDKGSVIIDMIKPDSKTIIWRGSAQANVQIEYVSEDAKKKRLKKAVEKILKDFPPNK